MAENDAQEQAAGALTPDEQEILAILAQAMTKFEALPVQIANDEIGFGLALYSAENVILSRPTVRWMQEKGFIPPQESDKHVH